MKILILTLGTQGDVQPYVALAKGLQRNNHQVTISTCEYFEDFIKAHGIDYHFMNNRFIDLINHSCSKTLLDSSSTLYQKFRSVLTLTSLSKDMMTGIFVDNWHAAKNTQPDIIIAHPKVLSASHICEALKIPLIIGSPIPTFEATNEFPLVGLPSLAFLPQSLSQWYNRASYKFTKKAHHIFDKKVSAFRQEHLNLPPCDPKSLPTEDHNGLPITHLHAFSPAVLAKPSDWRALAHVTGYWFLNDSVNWQPPKALQTFLLAGEAPLYIGFGSMAGGHAKRLGALILEALKQTNCRAIIATGWGGIEIDDDETGIATATTNSPHINENICIIKSAPHDWLFPQVSAVVHHGGAGSTAAALKAGKPSLICPFSMDQPFWGAHVAKLKVGLAPIHQKKLTAMKLRAALIELQNNELIINNAKAIGEKIRAEDGIQNAIDIIEEVARLGNPEPFE